MKNLYKPTALLFVLFSLLSFVLLSSCGDDDEKKTKYTIKYVSRDFTTDKTDTVESGALYTTKNIVLPFMGNSYSNLVAFTKGGTLIDLGYKKWKVDNSTTIRVVTTSAQISVRLSPNVMIFYTLDLGANECSQFYDVQDFPFTPGVKYITCPAGNKYKVTQWKDRFGNIYDGTNPIDQATYAKRGYIILYSHKKETVAGNSLTYNGNKNTFGSVPDMKVYTTGATATVADNTGKLKKPGFKFVGWNTKADGTGTTYSAGNTMTVNGDTTLYAKWSPNVWICFDKNASDATGTMPTGVIVNGTTYTVPNNVLSRTGYVFGGWNTRKDGSGYTYAPNSTMLLTHNITLYAKWNKAITPGNGIEIKPVNNAAGATISATRKLYWFVTTDQYCFNSGAVVTNGSISSISEAIKVDVPAGKYFVWGFIDMDNNGARSQGDYASISFNTSDGFYIGDAYSMEQYGTTMIKELNVTSSSGYLEAPMKFGIGLLGLPIHYVVPAQDAVITSEYKYTGSHTVDDTHQMNIITMVDSTDFTSSANYLGGTTLQMATAQLKFVVRVQLNKNYYFGAYVDAGGNDPDTQKTPSSGDPAVKYNAKQWSQTPDAFVATESKVYGILLEFNDTYKLP